jgi:uncharacterized protein
LTRAKSAIFFCDLRADGSRNIHDKIRILLDRAGLPAVVKKNDLVAVKLHFGEKGNTAFIRPLFIQPIINALSVIGSKPFLTDTNTLYCGERTEAVSHIATALKHGFNFTALNAPVIIADGLLGSDEERVPIEGRYFHEVYIASAILQADALICISHFKGHELSGFGGSLKNLGMGCASRQGKMKQHTDISPIIEPKDCIGCSRCISACPTGAIKLSKKKGAIEPGLCIGCAKCISICPQGAVQINWNENSRPFQEKMVEYAACVYQRLRKKVLFVNFLTDISPQCDCYGHADQPIVPDIGIMASTDPVAIDQASADFVNAQTGLKNSALKNSFKPLQDKFRDLYPLVDWTVQLSYAATLGMGCTNYKIVKI